jgi:hypothetical protein
MTSVPPEPPTGSEPSAAPPPPPQEWSEPSPTQPPSPPPSTHRSPSGRGFNPAMVNPKDWGILAAGLLAFIFSFVSYYSYSLGPLNKYFSAWDGFFGWFSTLLAVLSAALLAVELFAPQGQFGISVRLVVLGGFALATLFVVIAGFVDSRDVSGTSIDSSRGAGYYLSLIVILAGGVLSFLRLRETGDKLPGERTL